MNRYLLVAAIAFCLIAPTFASAADQMFMLVPGIPGSSLVRSHIAWIELSSFSGSASGPVSSVQVQSLTQPCQISVMKQLDIAGPRLWAATVTGHVFDTVEIQVVASLGTNTFVIYDVLLTTVQIVSIADSGAASGGTPTESVSFKAKDVKLTFTPQKEDGSPGTPVTTSFACD
jgi:type VI protein secretion system component Hcp